MEYPVPAQGFWCAPTGRAAFLCSSWPCPASFRSSLRTPAAVWLWKHFPREHRWVALASIVVGKGMGAAFRANFLGPLLLPQAGATDSVTPSGNTAG